MAWYIDVTDKRGTETRVIVKISHEGDALATVIRAYHEAGVPLDRVEMTRAS